MAQDYLRQSQPRRGTGGSTLAHRTSNLSDTEAQCLGLLNRSDPALSSTEARTIPAQTLDLIPISNTSIGNSRFSRCRSRTHVNDCNDLLSGAIASAENKALFPFSLTVRSLCNAQVDAFQILRCPLWCRVRLSLPSGE